MNMKCLLPAYGLKVSTQLVLLWHLFGRWQTEGGGAYLEEVGPWDNLKDVTNPFLYLCFWLL